MVVSNLVLLLNKIQLFPHNRVVLVLCAPHFEKYLDHVLRALVNIGFVEDVTHLVKDGVGNGRFHLVEKSADFLHDADGNLNRIVGRLVEQEQENFRDEDFMDDLGVDEVGKEHGTRQGDGLIIPPESLPELYDQTTNQQIADLG